jgi:hypothetical protein
LGELGELIEPQSKSRKEFIEECKSGKLDGILVAFRTFDSIEISGLFDEELVQVLPESLKFVCHNGMFLTQSLTCAVLPVRIEFKKIYYLTLALKSTEV